MKVATLLAFSALALAAPTQEASSNAATKIPLSRRRQSRMTRSNGEVDFQRFLKHVKYTVLKYNKDFELPEYLQDIDGQFANANNLLADIFKRDTDAEEPLTDQVESGEDELYYGVGYIGAAAQEFTFDFDTGSSDLFVPGPKCGTSQGCVGTTHYNQQGTDEHNTTQVTYGSGSVSGENYFDTVTVAGLTAHHQNVVSLTTATGFSTSDSDGLMGMAFESIANSKQPPFWMSLVQQGQISPTEFSFYLGRAASNTQGKSELTWGGRDSSRYTGATVAVPVSSQTYWQVAIDGATVGSGSTIAGTSGQAAIDTGTTLLLAPTAAAQAIYAQIPGSMMLPLAGGTTIQLYAYPCSSSPQVNLEFAGSKFAVNPLDFNFGTVSSQVGGIYGFLLPNYCVGGLAGADLVVGENLWIVGDTFLKNWYSTFQYVSPSTAYVNFAKAV